MRLPSEERKEPEVGTLRKWEKPDLHQREIRMFIHFGEVMLCVVESNSN